MKPTSRCLGAGPAASVLAFALVVLGPGPRGLIGQDSRTDVLRAPDGAAIHLTYYPAIADKNPQGIENAPVIVLLHGADQGRILWDKGSIIRTPDGAEGDSFPGRLQQSGYAAVTVDLRKFGESKQEGRAAAVRPDDYVAMAAIDLPMVKEFIFREHQAKQLNMNKLAIVAAGPTAPVAMSFAVADWQTPPHDDAPVLENRTPRGQDVRALVLLSPESTSGRLATTQSIAFLRNPDLGVAVLVIAGENDPKDKGQAKKLFDLFTAGQRKDQEQRMYMLLLPLKDRELGLVGKYPDQVEEPMVRFFEKHVKSFPSDWRDRRSRVTAN